MSQRSGGRRAGALGSDAVFTAVVFGAALLAVATAIFFLNRHPDSHVTVAAALPGSRAATSHHRRATHRGVHPAPAMAGATRRGALAVVQRSFDLTMARRYADACALESPAYLAFDAQAFRNGGCIAGSRAAMEAVQARGVSYRMISARIATYGAGRATVVMTSAIASRLITQDVYVQYVGGRWWITGGDDTGRDLGY